MPGPLHVRTSLRLAVAAAVWRSAKALGACSCDCCRVEVERGGDFAEGAVVANDRLECSYADTGLVQAMESAAAGGPTPVEAAAEPRCGPLCDRGEAEAMLEAAESPTVDTQRYCFFACAPVRRLSAEPGEGAPPDPAPGDRCRPLTQPEAEALESDDATGNGVDPMDQSEVSSQFLARRQPAQRQLSAAALARRGQLLTVEGQAPIAPAPAPAGGPAAVAPWSSLNDKSKQGNAEIMKMAEAANKKADDAQAAAKRVEKLSKKATDALPVALADAAEAKQAAEDASAAEKTVRSIRDQVRQMARKEAFSYIPEVLAKVRGEARKRVWVESGRIAAFEKNQLVQAGEAAAEAARKPYVEAQSNARQYADGWAKHGTDLTLKSQALQAQASQFEGNNVEDMAGLYEAAGDTKTAARLKMKIQTLMADAAAARDQAGEAFRTAASIQQTLPSYGRQAEQSAYAARSMFDPEAPPPAPLISVA